MGVQWRSGATGPVTYIGVPYNGGADGGRRATFRGQTSPAEAARQIFPPLDHALVKVGACELVAETKQPLSRQSLADVTARACSALGTPSSRSTVWRILDTDAIKSWRYKGGIFPRDAHLAEKAGPILDLYAGKWQGQFLGPKDSILSADEKPAYRLVSAAILPCLLGQGAPRISKTQRC